MDKKNKKKFKKSIFFIIDALRYDILDNSNFILHYIS